MFEYMPTFTLSIISFFNLFMPFSPLLSVSKIFPVNIWPINFKINNNNKKTFFLFQLILFTYIFASNFISLFFFFLNFFYIHFYYDLYFIIFFILILVYF